LVNADCSVAAPPVTMLPAPPSSPTAKIWYRLTSDSELYWNLGQIELYADYAMTDKIEVEDVTAISVSPSSSTDGRTYGPSNLFDECIGSFTDCDFYSPNYMDGETVYWVQWSAKRAAKTYRVMQVAHEHTGYTLSWGCQAFNATPALPNSPAGYHTAADARYKYPYWTPTRGGWIVDVQGC